MQSRRGFTIIELIVVISIIAILLTLTVLIISSSQANARDAKRNADIANIARGLETRFKEGNTNISAPAYVTAGDYPGLYEIQHILGASVTGFVPAQITNGYYTSIFPGTSTDSFNPPGIIGFTGFKYTCTLSCAANTAGFTETTLGASLTKDTYYYQPLDAAGNICLQGGCVRFQLFWRTEADGATHTLESRHQ